MPTKGILYFLCNVLNYNKNILGKPVNGTDAKPDLNDKTDYTIYKRGMSVCLSMYLSWGQWYVYVFKVSMRNIMVKSSYHQLYLHISNKNRLFTYILYLDTDLNSKDLILVSPGTL